MAFWSWLLRAPNPAGYAGRFEYRLLTGEKKCLSSERAGAKCWPLIRPALLKVEKSGKPRAAGEIPLRHCRK